MARRIPEKRIYNIELYFNSCVLFKRFKYEKSLPSEFKLMLKHHRCLISDVTSSSCGFDNIPGEERDYNSYEFLYLIFGNSWYNEAKDIFEYSLIGITGIE